MNGQTNIGRRYSIDFALILLAGNRTRYLTVRPIVEQDAAVVSKWYPIRTWVSNDWLGFLPGPARIRARHFLDSLPLYVRQMKRSPDAIVLHAFETYYLYALLHWLFQRKAIIVKNPDAGLPGSSHGLGGRLRDLAVNRTTLFVPWSTWAANLITRDYPHLSDDRFLVLHPGIDLSRWPLREPIIEGARFRLLFVGGDFLRKGADTLLDAFERYLSDTCELHIATQSGYLPLAFRERIMKMAHVWLYLDLTSNSDDLKNLYRTCHAFVLPTNADASPFVAIEAMATGLPVLICPVGGIPEIVRDGETGLLVPPKDPAALAQAIHRLRTSPDLQAKLTAQGRAHVEEHFDAQENTRVLLATIKGLIDQQSRQKGIKPEIRRAQRR